MRLQPIDSSYFCGKRRFGDDGMQNDLVAQPVYRYFKNFVNSNHISAWKPKGLSDESIKHPAASSNSLAPVLNYVNAKSCLKQDKVTFTYKKLINIYIV